MSLVVRSPLPFRLKKARKAKNISQKNLGILAGIDEFSASARMNHYEKGKHFPDFDTLARIAEVLGVPVPYFYCVDDDQAELMTRYHLMSTQQKTKLHSYMKNILSSEDFSS